jgi:DNA-binding transcriptional ArsR family regulator
MSILDFPSASGKDRKDLIAQARKATEMLKALSHEGRLLILCLLADGEKSVSEIEGLMDMPQAAVSQQLARLRGDGLVTARRDGRSIYYTIASSDAAKLIAALHDMLRLRSRAAPRRRRH